jgi:hypothetical protein
LIGTNINGTYPPTFTQKVVKVFEDYSTSGATAISKITCSKGCPGTASVTLGTTTTTGQTANNNIDSTVYTLVLGNWISKVSACSTTGVYDYTTGFGKGADAICTRANTPYACCTGKGTGTCLAVDACTGPQSPYACCTAPGQGCGIQDFVNYFQEQNIVHEIGHQLCLAADNTALNHHYQSQATYAAYAGIGTGAGSIMENAAYSKCQGGVSTFYIPAIFDASDPMKTAIAGMACPDQ